MNVVREQLPESRVTLDIQTDEQEFEKALERAYRKVVQQVRLPGFRPGKAPRKIIEQLLGREILVEQADRDLLDPLYQQALEREELTPVSEPEVEIYQPEPLAFKVTVQVYPAVTLGDYQAIRIEPRHIEIGDAQIDEALDRLRAQHSPWVEAPADEAEGAEPRPARLGDRVTLDVEVKHGDEQYREPLRDGQFVLGQDNLFPRLRDAVVGMRAGESRELQISFAEDDQQAEPDMRGKTLDYQVTLKQIEEQRRLPFDDDFASTVTNGRTTSFARLRRDLERDLRRVEREKARNEVSGEAIAALAAGTTLELPPALIERQLDSEIEELRTHLTQNHGQTLETHLRLENKTLDQLREELQPEATRKLRNSLVLRELATREGISVSAGEIDAEIERLVGQGTDAEQMRQIYGSSYVRNLLETELFERKLLDRLIEIVTEGRGAFEPPADPAEDAAEEPEAAPIEATATPAGATADEVATPDTDEPGILPADQQLPVQTAEAVAESETVAPAPTGEPEGEVARA